MSSLIDSSLFFSSSPVKQTQLVLLKTCFHEIVFFTTSFLRKYFFPRRNDF